MKIPHMNNVGVRYRLGLLVILSIIALLAVGFGGWVGISKVSRSVIVLQDERLPAATLLGEIRSSTNLLLQFSFEVLLREKQANAQNRFAGLLERKKLYTAALNKAMEDYEKIPKSTAETEAWTKFKESMGPWKASNETLTGILKLLSENDDFDKQPQLFVQYKAPLSSWGYVQATVDRNLTNLVTLNKAEVEAARERDAQTVQLAMRFMVITLALSVAILLVLAVVFVRGITGPLEYLRRTIVSVANDSDFTERVSTQGKDEIAQTA